MRGDSKVGSNDSPEIPDRGETSDIPNLPSVVPSKTCLSETAGWERGTIIVKTFYTRLSTTV